MNVEKVTVDGKGTEFELKKRIDPPIPPQTLNGQCLLTHSTLSVLAQIAWFKITNNPEPTDLASLATDTLEITGCGKDMATQAADSAKKDYERMLQREEEPELLITMPPGLQVKS